MEEMDLFEEIQHEEADDTILEELHEKRKASKKTFSSVINKRKLSKFELDEVMV